MLSFLRVSPQNYVFIAVLPYACLMPPSSRPSSSRHQKNILWRVQILKHLILTSTVEGDKCLASRSGGSTSTGIAPVPTGWIPELVWKERRREYPPANAGIDSSVVQPVAKLLQRLLKTELSHVESQWSCRIKRAWIKRMDTSRLNIWGHQLFWKV